jgi:hypothetical protein
MRFLPPVVLGVLAISSGANAFAQSADPGSQPLKCEIGPLPKTFGKVQWLVYGCADAKSLVVVSAPGSPAMPFNFMFFPKSGRYELVGEGTGRKEATAAAYAELSALSEEQMAKLVSEVHPKSK